MPEIHVAFQPGDRVKVLAINELATVLGVTAYLSGRPQYEVGYWLNGEWRRVWLPAGELKQTENIE